MHALITLITGSSLVHVIPSLWLVKLTYILQTVEQLLRTISVFRRQSAFLIQT